MSVNRTRFFGKGLPYVDVSELNGKLIVIEGTDGVGRSSQIEDLRRWLEIQGYGVVTTGWTRSPLMGQAINEAKAGHTLNVNTFSLLYAADFAEPSGKRNYSCSQIGFHRACRPVHLYGVCAVDRPRRRP